MDLQFCKSLDERKWDALQHTLDHFKIWDHKARQVCGEAILRMDVLTTEHDIAPGDENMEALLGMVNFFREKVGCVPTVVSVEEEAWIGF
jgi:hypothetical protein